MSNPSDVGNEDFLSLLKAMFEVKGLDDDEWSVDQILSKNLSAPFSVLVGAGISYPPPSNLLTAGAIMETIIRALPVTEEHKSTLLQSTSPDWEDGLGYFDFLRFEQLMQEIGQNVDEELSLLRIIFSDTLSPNQYHYQLARLLSNGNRLLTTNFDCLIEQACNDLGIHYTVLASEQEYQEYETNPEKYPNPIFKLHGTYGERTSKSASTELSTTIEAVTTERLSNPAKWRVVEKILSEHDLLVLGYSGSDDFDVMVAIRFMKSRQHIVWVQHNNQEIPDIWVASIRLPANISINPKLFTFFGRTFGSFNHFGKVQLRPGDILVLTAKTNMILDKLIALSETPQVTHNAPANRSIAQNSLLEHVQEQLRRDPPKTSLFVAKLFYDIGLFRESLHYLNEARNHFDDTTHVETMARVNALMGNIYLEQYDADKADPYITASLQHFTRIKLSAVEDIINATRLACVQRLRKGGIPSQRDIAPFLQQDSNVKQLWQLNELTIWQLRAYLEGGDVRNAITTFNAIDLSEVEEEQRADTLFLSLQLEDILDSFRVSSLSDSQEQTILSEIINIYELHQKKVKWAHAQLYEAEGHLAAAFPEWADESAQISHMVFKKIGNKLGMLHSQQIRLRVAEIDGREEDIIELRNEIEDIQKGLQQNDHDVSEVERLDQVEKPASYFRYDLFLSYGPEDKTQAVNLAKHLTMFGIKVVLDKSAIKWGHSKRYNEADLRSSHFVGLVISRASISKVNESTGYQELEKLIISIEQELEKRTSPILINVGDYEYSGGSFIKSGNQRLINLSPLNYKVGFVELLQYLGCDLSPRHIFNPIDGTELIYVPGGVYIWGYAGAESPIEVTGFYIGITKVSNSQYANFLEAVPKSVRRLIRPTTWRGRRYAEKGFNQTDKHVGGISHYAAEAYCSWAGLRLPTAFELEYIILGAASHHTKVPDLQKPSLNFEWTSTSGEEFGKNSKDTKMLMSTALGMRRNGQLPSHPKVALADTTFRCAADVDWIYSPKF